MRLDCSRFGRNAHVECKELELFSAERAATGRHAQLERSFTPAGRNSVFVKRAHSMCGKQDVGAGRGAFRKMCRRLASAKTGMFIQRVVASSVALAFVSVLAPPSLGQVAFASKERAFLQGYSAFKGRQFEIAVPALEFAASRNVMRAKFYLAKIYSDNSGGWTDHAKAYGLLQRIVRGYANVDPKDYRVAPFVSQALTSIARYERDGIKKLKLAPDTKRALIYFDHAATYFNDEDAQFELAKHYLAGDGVEVRVPYALNWLARLSKRGHAGAQAFLANLYWDGRYTQRDRVRALALITVAVENAAEEDRFWIEDVHQNIFCEANSETRRRVHAVVGGWRRKFGRAQSLNVSTESQVGLGSLTGDAQRTCANGDVVGVLISGPRSLVGPSGSVETAAVPNGVHAGKGEPPTVLMSRVKPDGQSRAKLNGYVLREAGDSTAAAQSAGSGGSLDTRNAATETGRVRQNDNGRSLLNGFVLQGNSGFGFSSKPHQ